MNTHLLTKGYIVEKVDTEDLFKILKEVAAVKEGNLCTVQIAEGWYDDLYLYGVWENSYEWVENYHNSGGVWSYHRPEFFLKVVEEELNRRGLYATNVRA